MKSNPALLAKLANDFFNGGNFIRKSRAGVTYHKPFSRRSRWIQPDGREYVKTPRGYFVRADRMAHGNGLAA